MSLFHCVAERNGDVVRYRQDKAFLFFRVETLDLLVTCR